MANVAISNISIDSTPMPYMIISYLAIDSATQEAERVMLSWIEVAKNTSSSRTGISTKQIATTTGKGAGKIKSSGRSNKQIAIITGKGIGTNTIPVVGNQIVISFIEINSAGISGTSSKQISKITGNASGLNAQLAGKVFISWIEIIKTPSRTGRSTKQIAKITGSAKGTSVSTVAQPPIITSIYPINGTTISGGSVTVTASIYDNYYPITKVEIYIDGLLKKTDKVVPYTYLWTWKWYNRGLHSITIKAYNSAGKVATAASTVRLR